MRISRVLLAIAPLVVVALVFCAVLRGVSPPSPWARGALPHATYDPARCNWYCHNHGCRHRAALTRVLSGDDGLFGWTVAALHRAGRLSSRPLVGYGAANLALFCAVWPGAMYVLYLIALRQRFRLRDARRAQRQGDARPR
jgi:hypothetical protein